MNTEYSGTRLSCHNDEVYMGGHKTNGILLPLHENAWTIGYSKIMKADGTEPNSCKFGNAVWYDANKTDNIVYTGVPSYDGANPVFAGIMAYSQEVASSFPVTNDQTDNYNKGMLVKDGFVIYKKGKLLSSGEEAGFGNIFVGWVCMAKKSDGTIYFGASNTDPTNYLTIGVVGAVNPQGKDVTVAIDKDAFLITANVPSKPTVTAGTATNTEIPCTVTSAKGVRYIEWYIGTTTGTYTLAGTSDCATDGSSSFTFEDLTKNTTYYITAKAVNAGGTSASATEVTKATANV